VDGEGHDRVGHFELDQDLVNLGDFEFVQLLGQQSKIRS
jgi:hypothetical protein